MFSFTVSHFKRASNHNRTSTVYCSPLTVSHFKRASNHNRLPPFEFYRSLFHISKEHQITTSRPRRTSSRYCFTFQKSIKSQHLGMFHHRRGTVSHFKRASNHNRRSSCCIVGLLFHISKEHQITTEGHRLARASHCFTFQKSIKSQQTIGNYIHTVDCFTFQKSIKSQPRPPLTASRVDCFTFQKSIKSQHYSSEVACLAYCFTFQKSIKSQPSRRTQGQSAYCFTFQKSIKSQPMRGGERL